MRGYDRDELISLGREVIEKALAMGFDEAAVSPEYFDASMIKFANSEPSVVQSWRERRVSVYVSKDRRILGTSGSVESIEDVHRLLTRLKNVSGRIPESMLYAPLPGPAEVSFLGKLVDEKVLEVIEDPITVSEVIVEAANREKIDYFAGMFEARYEAWALITSKGVELFEEGTSIKSYIRSFVEGGSGQWSYGSRKLNIGKIEDMAETASRYARMAKHPVEVSPGKYNIILSPMVVGNLMNYVAFMASAMRVMMGMSIFATKKPGSVVASEEFTLIDDPRNVDLPRSRSFDDEGLPTYSKPIIENGVLKTLLHNTKTASKMGGKSTGNAGLVFPQPWNITIPAGDKSLEELVSEAQEGFLVTNNWYTRLQNWVEGIFSTITRDAILIIKDGEITGAAKKFRIADSFPRMLNNIGGLGKETYDIYWWEVDIPTRTPYILFKDVHTSKHTG